MTRSFYRVRWDGTDYEAAPELRADGVWLRLRGSAAGPGFAEVAPGRWVRTVPAAECERVDLVTTVCAWKGVSFLVIAERDGEVLLEYPGGSAPVAVELGLERVERGVYRRWVARDDVAALREQAVDLGKL
ncbi:hypothetical protein AB0F17_05290 [Nonomuraea sp. NPDC026600]|uniref:hypothetical protein n=1 Tax=Nonomuraea sp. NPDC026600 TaxID=3155363 RepID=UPI0033F914E9